MVMPDLVLSVCPICDSRHSVFRQSAAVQDREMVWYECRTCSSFLLWAGSDQWIYQKVGCPEKAHLLKQTLTTAELEAMAEAAAEKLTKVLEPAEQEEPEWGARLNTVWQRKATDYPRWVTKAAVPGWGDKGLFVWHRDSKTITKLRPTQAARLLDFLQTEEAWKQQGIEVFETPVQLKLGDPDWKPEDPRVNLIALDPSQAQELFKLLTEKESELRQMAKEEEEDTQRRWAQVFDLLLSARKRTRTDELKRETGYE
jgi:hypothetical protein